MFPPETGKGKKKIPIKGKRSEEEDAYEKIKSEKNCQYHGTCEHTTDKCTTLKPLNTSRKRLKVNQLKGQCFGGKESKEGFQKKK